MLLMLPICQCEWDEQKKEQVCPEQRQKDTAAANGRPKSTQVALGEEHEQRSRLNFFFSDFQNLKRISNYVHLSLHKNGENSCRSQEKSSSIFSSFTARVELARNSENPRKRSVQEVLILIAPSLSKINFLFRRSVSKKT